ncbi:hypothetical protein CHEID_07255 [Corynebacterium heidelbergense]|nr:hypothetical protein CHEID_07255 [Corynebacterium heidelbergense]
MTSLSSCTKPHTSCSDLDPTGREHLTSEAQAALDLLAEHLFPNRTPSLRALAAAIRLTKDTVNHIQQHRYHHIRSAAFETLEEAIAETCYTTAQHQTSRPA